MSNTDTNRRLKAPPDYISVISASECARIKISDIEIIEQDGRRIHVVTAERDYSFYGSLNSIAVSLADRAFYRILKSMIVNFDHVKDITGISINFNSGQSVTVGRNTIIKTRKAYKRYLMKYPPYSLWDPIQMCAIGVYENSDSYRESTCENT